MDKKVLDELLEKDELVLWSGKPAPYKIFDKYYKPVFIKNYLIAFLIGSLIFAAVLVYLTNADKLYSTDIMDLITVGVICFSPLLGLPLEIIDSKVYFKKCNYFVTNKNIRVYISESKKLKCPLSNIEKYESVQQDEGTMSIRIGKSVGIPLKNNWDYALDCLTKDHTGEKNICLLYNLTAKDASIVLELIKKYRVAD